MPGGRVVFDIAQSGPGLNLEPWVGLLAMAAIAVAVIIFWRVQVSAWLTRIGLGWLTRFGGIKSPLFNLIWGGAVLGLILVAVSGYATTSSRLRESYRTGAGAVVAGCITQFHPSSGQRGDDEEMIEISGTRFVYSDDILTPAFHQTVLHGGPLHPDS